MNDSKCSFFKVGVANNKALQARRARAGGAASDEQKRVAGRPATGTSGDALCAECIPEASRAFASRFQV